MGWHYTRKGWGGVGAGGGGLSNRINVVHPIETIEYKQYTVKITRNIKNITIYMG